MGTARIASVVSKRKKKKRKKKKRINILLFFNDSGRWLQFNLFCRMGQYSRLFIIKIDYNAYFKELELIHEDVTGIYVNNDQDEIIMFEQLNRVNKIPVFRMMYLIHLQMYN